MDPLADVQENWLQPLALFPALLCFHFQHGKIYVTYKIFRSHTWWRGDLEGNGGLPGDFTVRGCLISHPAVPVSSGLAGCCFISRGERTRSLSGLRSGLGSLIESLLTSRRFFEAFTVH